MTFPRYARPFGIGFAVLLGVALLATGCDDDTTGPSPGPRAFNQVQRLGNPLVSEVLLEKRDHDTHGSTGPDQDAARIAARVKSFIINVAGRASAYADVLGGVLVPDMLIVQTDRPGNTAGWLNWVGIAPLANGYGGRQLSDDVTDLAPLAVSKMMSSTPGDSSMMNSMFSECSPARASGVSRLAVFATA